MVLSYLPNTGLTFCTSARSGSVAGPSREDGGRISVFCTIVGAPLASSVETSASPTPISVIAASVLKAGFGRKDEAADFTAFCSVGV